MAQRARPARRHRARQEVSKVRVFVAVFAAAAVVAAAVIMIVNFYKQTESNLEKTAYPLEYTNLVNKAAKEYNLEPELIYGVIHTESKFNPDADSSAGALGLMQVMPETFDWLAEKRGEAGKYSAEDLYKPEVNVDYGSYLLRYFLDYYGNEQCAVAAYNAGFAVSDWLADPNLSSDGITLDVIPYPETSEYVDRVEYAKQKYIELYFS